MINIFIGTSGFGADAEAQMVLEYSIKKHTSVDVNIRWLKTSQDPNSKLFGWSKSRWGTPFSGYRWAIPEICDFKGKAIYMDSDVMVLSDLKNLWNQEFDDNKVVLSKGEAAPQRYCVSLWNNEYAKNFLPSVKSMRIDPFIHDKMIDFFADNQEIVQPFEGNWNCVDGEGLPIEEIQTLHFSDMQTQPHLMKYTLPRLRSDGRKHWSKFKPKPHPRQDLQRLFDKYYQEALDSGYKVENYF